MDKLYRNVKTGEVKPLPIKVYQAVKKHWRPVEENVMPLTDTAVETKVSPIRIDTDLDVIPSNDLTPAKESLQAAYETLSGAKPDKRWSEKKLIQKIEELKETK